MFNRIIYLFITALLLSFQATVAQTIVLDESYDDWTTDDQVAVEIGDNVFTDFETLSIANDESYLYFRVKLNRELLLQSNSNIILAIDIDNNAQTGFSIEGIGSELVFNFGSRVGRIYRGSNQFEIYHNDIGLITSPTVSSDEFEIAIARNFNVGNQAYKLEDNITMYLYVNDGSTGDFIPNRGDAARYSFDEDKNSIQEFEIEKDDQADLRIMSYNVRRDDIFELSKSLAYQNILKAISPDVFCFQEIYDNSALDVYEQLLAWEVIDESHDWNYAKNGNDIITISKYPIKFDREITGNGMIVIDVNDEDFAIFNLHLPCCENDSGREREIDQMLALIRESKVGNTNYPFKESTPFVILGDMNFVGRSSQVSGILEGNIFDNSSYGSDFGIDWDGSNISDLIPQTTGFSSSFTWINEGSSFFPGRLDYIFYSDSQLDALNSYVFNTRALPQNVLDQYNLQSSYTGIASDHLPLICDFKTKVEVSTNDLKVALPFKIYPNPGSQLIRISAEKNLSEIGIYTINNKLIANNSNITSETTTLNINNLEDGIYIVKCTDGDGFTSSKLFVKQQAY